MTEMQVMTSLRVSRDTVGKDVDGDVETEGAWEDGAEVGKAVIGSEMTGSDEGAAWNS